MSIFPGWNSVESAASYSKWFTYAGWAALFLLGIFEILAHTYGTRKDVLMAERENSAKDASDRQISSLKSKLEQEGRAFRTEADSMKEETRQAKNLRASAEQALNDLTAKESQRIIAPEQKKKLIEILSTSPGHEVYVLSPRGDKEAQTYADEFADVLAKSGWKVLPNEFWMTTITRDYEGFHIWVAAYDNPAGSFLQKALKDVIGIYADGGLAEPLKTHDHKDACVLYVGFK